MASPPPPQSQFIPTLLATLLTILVLGVVWKIVYNEIDLPPLNQASDEVRLAG